MHRLSYELRARILNMWRAKFTVKEIVERLAGVNTSRTTIYILLSKFPKTSSIADIKTMTALKATKRRALQICGWDNGPEHWSFIKTALHRVQDRLPFNRGIVINDQESSSWPWVDFEENKVLPADKREKNGVVSWQSDSKWSWIKWCDMKRWCSVQLESHRKITYHSLCEEPGMNLWLFKGDER